ncbi:MAG: hypothetical protein IJ150_04565 [Bacteroidales bacterium]|jgi:hypothetical protein|nr:hypothetical protein [Bacteroidales bacterium]
MQFLHVIAHQIAHHADEKIREKGGCAGCFSVLILLIAIAGLIAYIVF